MLKRRLHDERGAMMVVAILVSMVLLTLSVYATKLAIHENTMSGYDRARVTSIAAAEAGIDWMWSTINRASPQSLPCTNPATGTVGSAPIGSTYSVQAKWYNASGTLMNCPLSMSPPYPSSGLLTSTGTAAGVSRKMQSFATLTPITGGIGAAMLSQGATDLAQNFQLNPLTTLDADIYINTGDLNITNSPIVYGNIYVPAGNYSQANGSFIKGNVWANGSVQVNQPAQVGGDVTSSTSSLSGTGTIAGSMRAGTTIASSLVGSGTRTPNSPQGAPPSMPFPYVCWSAVSPNCSAQSADWTTAGYTVNNYADCTSAKTALTTTTFNADTVIRINAVCSLSISQSDVINFTKNLAIFTNGSITMANLNNWNGVVGKNLYFIVNYQSTSMNCASGSYDITTGQNSNFNNVAVSFYSPCNVNIANQNQFKGPNRRGEGERQQQLHDGLPTGPHPREHGKSGLRLHAEHRLPPRGVVTAARTRQRLESRQPVTSAGRGVRTT